ncbi:hypothetical protein MST22_17350 [Virgibacillus halodenitrificans]|uniref:DUF2508 family protein n=1 Tax=Virgibacillus halodenitrificans TaxID=1482 RepID=A0ABR7VPW3_VIRHA|nr:hypothetical protein [Virgibacillus halodenitrificans]MBD1223295.1 hypothetical protein [Virgibacillus halodenitrificans]MCJ0932920.1 hypothetical protein [Virgibacillus halodenitrificans]
MDEVIQDAAHYLQVYDIDLIYSWTPREYRLLVKGAQHREIDEYERMARSAMFNRYASNAKHAKEKKMFDADKARKRLDAGDKKYKDSKVINLQRYRKAKKAMELYLANQSKKGG